MGGGDWLTSGVDQIAPWRNSLAMVLAFPDVILYGIVLFSIGGLIAEQKQQRMD